jgi:hypothetical protein
VNLYTRRHWDAGTNYTVKTSGLVPYTDVFRKILSKQRKWVGRRVRLKDEKITQVYVWNTLKRTLRKLGRHVDIYS